MDDELNKLLKEVHSKQVALLDELQKKRDKPKDQWDKFSALAPFITGIAGVLIAVLGLYFTHSFNERQAENNKSQVDRDVSFKNQQADREENLRQHQIKLSEIQTVGTFMPYLIGSEKNKEVAIIMIAELTNQRLAGKIIAKLGGQGGISAGETLIRTSQGESKQAVSEALISLSKTGKENDKELANAALDTVFSGSTYMGAQGENIKIEVVPQNFQNSEPYFAASLNGKPVTGNPFTFSLNSNVGSSMLLLLEFSFFRDAPINAGYDIEITGSSGTLHKTVSRTDPATHAVCITRSLGLYALDDSDSAVSMHKLRVSKLQL